MVALKPRCLSRALISGGRATALNSASIRNAVGAAADTPERAFRSLGPHSRKPPPGPAMFGCEPKPGAAPAPSCEAQQVNEPRSCQ